MAICPNGHDSASDDFCDVCGMRIGGSPSSGNTGGSGTSSSTPAYSEGPSSPPLPPPSGGS